jgi:hypothetical protein
VPFYCAQDYEKIRSVYGAVLSKFTVKIRIVESIDLGLLESTKKRLEVHEGKSTTTGPDAENKHLAIRSVKEIQLEIAIMNMLIGYFKEMGKRCQKIF